MEAGGIELNDLQAIKLLPVSLIASIAHRVFGPLIVYFLRRRHPLVSLAYPISKPGETAVDGWRGLYFLLKFMATLQFARLNDTLLAILCIVDAMVFAVTVGTLAILVAHFLWPAFYSVEFVFWELIDLLRGRDPGP